MTKSAGESRFHHRHFLFVSPAAALALARIGTAALFAIHAIVRIVNGSIPRFAAFMDSAGFVDGFRTVWMITIAELAAALLLAGGVAVRLAAAALMSIAIGGIILIHRHFGWFVGEHGTGGSEYSVALILLLLVAGVTNGDSKPS